MPDAVYVHIRALLRPFAQTLASTCVREHSRTCAYVNAKQVLANSNLKESTILSAVLLLVCFTYTRTSGLEDG